MQVMSARRTGRTLVATSTVAFLFAVSPASIKGSANIVGEDGVGGQLPIVLDSHRRGQDPHNLQTEAALVPRLRGV